MDIHADLVYTQTGYDVISYFQSAFLEAKKTAENATSNGFVLILFALRFCLSHQLVGFVCKILCCQLLLVHKHYVHYPSIHATRL